MAQTDSVPPLTPADCDLRDFPSIMLDIVRLRGSSFDAITDDSAWRAGVNLWLTSWHQVPAASLEDDEASLAKAAGLGRDVRTWRKVSKLALRGWLRCADGRLYHETVAETALGAWLEKLGQRLSSGAGNAKKYGREFDPSPINADIALAASLLLALNPKAKALGRQHVVKALAAPTGTPGEPPTGSPGGSPGGSGKSPGGSPAGSQEKRREGKLEESDADASSARERAELVLTAELERPAPKPRKRAPGDLTAAEQREFDEFWAVYCRKTDVGKAEIAFARVLRTSSATFDEIMAGNRAHTAYHKARGTEQRFIKQGESWLNGKCWRDELEVPEPGRANGFGGRPAPRTALDQALEGLDYDQFSDGGFQ